MPLPLRVKHVCDARVNTDLIGGLINTSLVARLKDCEGAV